MSELASAVEATVTVDVTGLSDEQLREDLVALPRQMAGLKAAWLQRVRECERRQLHQLDGHRSAGAWLGAYTLASGREGASAAWLARRLARLPLTLAALLAGEISETHARQIAWLAKDVAAEVMADGEAHVVEAARHCDASDFRRLIDRLRAQWIPEQVGQEHDDAYGRRRLDFGEAFAGLVPLSGLLDPLTADKLRTVINALGQPDAGDVPAEARRSPAQRRHDALDEACSRLLDLGQLPTVRRERPHITVFVNLADLTAGVGAAESEWSGTIGIGAAQMLACDARVHPLIDLGGHWDTVIVEDHDTASKRLWRYLRTRDRGCRFPGCDIPAIWCDAHHVVFRAADGPTSNTNCALLCRYHHRLIHAEHRPWIIHGDPETTLTFTAPSGQAHTSPVPARLRCP
ncbi:MAG TPA: DUF222 domain-containing protein [Nitriliruptorales bacterium]